MPSAPVYVLIPIALGLLGCQLDSVLGATLERRGLVSKKTVNLVSTTTGAIVAYAILITAGPLPTACALLVGVNPFAASAMAPPRVRPSAYTRENGPGPCGPTGAGPLASRNFT